jgi:glycosyltransferase involved in cell wall biosynthesis
MSKSLVLVRQQIPEAALVWMGARPHNARDILKNQPGAVVLDHVPEEQLNLYLAACDAFWLPLMDTPANRGRWPHKLNDYMCIGRPVVATAVGDVKEVISRWPFGLLASDSPASFAQQTIELLQNPARAEQMGNIARATAEQEFSWANIGLELEKLYQTC